MKSALLYLREMKNSLPTTEKTIAQYIIEQPETTIKSSIHKLAKDTYTSPSTIIRLCNRLGFNGYKDFKNALTYEFALSRKGQSDKEKEIYKTDSTDDIIEKITYKNIISLEDTKNLLQSATVDKVVDLLIKADKILLFGIGASQVAAKDASLKFLRLNKTCVINEDHHSQLLQAINSNKNDIAIIFTYSGETVEMVNCIKHLNDNNTTTIAITRLHNSTIAKLSDYKLNAASNESLFRSGAMSSRISQLNIIDIIYTVYANRNFEENINLLSKNYIRKPNT